MAKRFTDTDKWKRPWFRSLSTKAKLIWGYLCDQCDHTGTWIADFEILEVQTGLAITEAELLEWFQGKVVKVESDKFCIPSFYQFQYSEAKDGFKAKQSAQKTLKKYGLMTEDGTLTQLSPNCSEQLPNSPELSMDCPSIGISIGISKKGSVRGNKSPDFDFEPLYANYPRKEGKAEGMAKLKKRSKAWQQERFDQFAKAVHNYRELMSTKDPQYVKHWSSFIGTDEKEPWTDYIEKQNKGGVSNLRQVPHEWAEEISVFRRIQRAYGKRQEAEAAEVLGKDRWPVIVELGGWTSFCEIGAEADYRIYTAAKNVYSRDAS